MFNNKDQVLDFLSKKIADYRILVFGDVMLDRYYFGEVKRISPEAPVPVTRVTHENKALGGAANVASNLARLGAKVELVGITGQDESRRCLGELFATEGIEDEGLLAVDRPTTTKLRILGGHQQMLRLDFEENHPVSGKIEEGLKKYVSQAIQGGQAQAVVISDYAKGVCTNRLCQHVVRECNKAGIPLVVDPKGTNWKKYAGAPVITPNLKELGEAFKTEIANEDQAINSLAEKARKRFNIDNIIVTRSEKGMSVIGAGKAAHISTYAQEVFDVSGAGDTVIAVLGAALAGGLDLIDAAHLANLAAGIAVGKLGTYAVKRTELLEALKPLVGEGKDLA